MARSEEGWMLPTPPLPEWKAEDCRDEADVVDEVDEVRAEEKER